jgi:integrase
MKITERIRLGQRGNGSLLRYEDSSNWTFSYYQHGKEHRVSTRTGNEKVARRFAKRRLDEVSADRQGLKTLVAPTAARSTVNQLLDAYLEDLKLREVKSLYKTERHMVAVREHFGFMRATSVTAEIVDRYITAKQNAGKTNGTINRGTAILATAFRLACERKRVSEVPQIRKLSETNVRQGFFEQEQIDALIGALPDYLQDLTRFTYLCGWRKGEVVGLTWPMVNMVAETITIPTSKNGRLRTLDLDGEVLAIMKRREKAATFERDGEPMVATHVFHRDGAPIGDFKKAWHSALVRAGLTHKEKVPGSTKVRIVHDVLFHDLRRTAARNLLAKGVRETVAMKITGHATRSMFDRYSIVSSDDVKKAMKAVKVGR